MKDERYTARVIEVLAAASDERIETDQGELMVAEAVANPNVTDRLIRYGLLIMNAGGLWSQEDDRQSQTKGIPVSIIATAFDYAVEVAPRNENGAICLRTVTDYLERASASGIIIAGYPAVARECALIVSGVQPSAPSNSYEGGV